jgi:hypothetical protein
MLYNLHCSIVKKLMPVLENQNGVNIQDGVEKVLYLSPEIFKHDIFSVFLLFFYILGENKIFMEKLFS